MSLSANWKKWKAAWMAGGKKSLRRYHLIAVTYLAVIVLALALLVARWSPPPLPGEEGGPGQPPPAFPLEAVTESDPAAVAPDAPPAPAAPGAAPTAPPPAPGAEPDHGPEPDAATFPALTWPDTAPVPAPAEQTLPPPARPLPRFKLYAPFGRHSADLLPSGGRLHRLSRGVLLQAEAAAPVSVLWDGRVSQVEVKQGLYRCSVLVEHDGGYSTYYGNLREVWVREGSFVSRGENIGVMPYSREDAAAGSPSLPVSGRIPAAGYALEVRTVFGGPRPDPLLPSLPAPPPPPQGERQGPGEAAAAAPPSPPLLYLEVRRDGAFLDPLNFLGARH